MNFFSTIAKKIRFFYWFSHAYTLKHIKIISASFIGGFFFFFLIFRITPIITASLLPETKRVGIIGQYTPSSLPIPVKRLIGAGFTDIAENGEAKPGLAESWDISNDGKTYTFHLRKGLSWHDKNPFVARDVNYNIKDVTFEIKNDSTLVVHLTDPFAPLPVLFSRPLIKQNLSGLGPYKVTGVDFAGDRLKSMSLSPQNNGLPGLTLKFYLTEEQAKTAFMLGEVDILEDISDPNPFTTWPNAQVTKRIDYTKYVALFYNANDKILGTKSVRQALSFSVPNLEEERVTGPISPLSWAYNNKVRQYKFDLSASERLLGKDFKNSTDSAQLTISTFTPYLGLAKRIAESWQSLGFSVNIKSENAIPDNYQVLLASQEIPPDPDQYPLWHSTQKDTNVTNYVNLKIDALLEQGRKTTDREERLKIYTDFQRYLVDDAPATFLYYPTVYTISRK